VKFNLCLFSLALLTFTLASARVGYGASRGLLETPGSPRNQGSWEWAVGFGRLPIFAANASPINAIGNRVEGSGTGES